jgi:hypothetical protein
MDTTTAIGRLKTTWGEFAVIVYAIVVVKCCPVAVARRRRKIKPDVRSSKAIVWHWGELHDAGDGGTLCARIRRKTHTGGHLVGEIHFLQDSDLSVVYIVCNIYRTTVHARRVVIIIKSSVVVLLNCFTYFLRA